MMNDTYLVYTIVQRYSNLIFIYYGNERVGFWVFGCLVR